MKGLFQQSRRMLLQMLSKIHKTGKLPQDFRTSTFIPIPKENNVKKYPEFQTISLISHTLKILLAISNRRMERKIDYNIDEVQSGFRIRSEMRNATGLFESIRLSPAREANTSFEQTQYRC